MKKNVLTLAVAGAVAASAQAQMFVNPDNTGEALIYPFYSADNGNQTYIHVVNTTGLAKAAKVRILEAENSYEVRDFNLYLSPYDHFSFAINLDDGGGAKLVTGDTSCTVPAIPEGGIEFTNLLYDEEENASLERTLNGYVEIIEMGQFQDAKAVKDAVTGAVTTPAKIGWYWTHDSNGVPNGCDTVVEAWAQDGEWWDDVFVQTGATGDFDRLASGWQGGGLYGMGIIVNPEAGAAIGYDAVAIDAFVKSDSAAADLHYYPGDEDPSLAGNGSTATSATIFDDGKAVTFTGISGTTGGGIGEPTLDSVSALFMVDKVMNDYVLDPTFAGKTDWVITFPTKRLYVEDDGTTAVTQALRPFLSEWDENESCDPYNIKVYDREEQTPVADLVQPPFSPYTPGENSDPSLCYEANVLTFTPAGEDAESPLFGVEPSASAKRLQTVVETPYDNGWAVVNFNWNALLGKPYELNDPEEAVEAHELTMASSSSLDGLPAVGFSVIRFGNSTLSGGTVLANYAAAHEHKTSRTTSGGDVAGDS